MTTILRMPEHPCHHGPAAAWLTLRHAPGGPRPGMRSTGESIRIPMQRSVVSSEAEISSFALSLCRLTEPRSGPLWQCVTQSGFRFRKLTLMGILRHSKRFFGQPSRRIRNATYAIRRTASARAMPERSCRTAAIARPAFVNRNSTSRCCPAPISTTRSPPGASRRGTSAAIAR